jgi:hypothetical protein
LGTEIVTDLKGSAGSVGYIYWVSSIVAVGAVGYYTPLQKFSRLFMFLIIIGMVLSNQGLFAKIQEALKSTGTTPSAAPTGSQAAAGTNTTNVSNIADASKLLSTIGPELVMAFV